MWIYATLPFLFQALAIGIDEAYFHYRRGLPKWERLGHPLDTLSFLICLQMPLWLPFNNQTLAIYSLFALLSCIMITKDEFVHKEYCSGAENWLHACLFILHPLTLITTGVIWSMQKMASSSWVLHWLDEPIYLHRFLFVQTIAIGLFFFYQLIFWNVIWKDRPVIKL